MRFADHTAHPKTTSFVKTTRFNTESLRNLDLFSGINGISTVEINERRIDTVRCRRCDPTCKSHLKNRLYLKVEFC